MLYYDQDYYYIQNTSVAVVVLAGSAHAGPFRRSVTTTTAKTMPMETMPMKTTSTPSPWS